MAVLSKLLKYDLRANLKIFLFIWPAILVFGLLERVALMAELPVKISAIFVNLTTVLFARGHCRLRVCARHLRHPLLFRAAA